MFIDYIPTIVIFLFSCQFYIVTVFARLNAHHNYWNSIFSSFNELDREIEVKENQEKVFLTEYKDTYDKLLLYCDELKSKYQQPNDLVNKEDYFKFNFLLDNVKSKEKSLHTIHQELNACTEKYKKCVEQLRILNKNQVKFYYFGFPNPLGIKVDYSAKNLFLIWEYLLWNCWK